MEFKGKLFIRGEIEVKTGIHVGGSTNSLDIGGVDAPVVKDAEGVPFIPGSSLKGKIRSLLEWKNGRFTIKMGSGKEKEEFKVKELKEFWIEYLKSEGDKLGVYGSPCSCGECNVCKLFGTPADKGGIYPQRLIVRDAFLDKDAFAKLFGEENEFLETRYGEVKYENSIDRLTSAATPRQIERVPAGARFKFEIVFNLFGEDDKELLQTLFDGMRLLEDDYLGGHGSRGYGQVIFTNIKIVKRSRGYYEGREKEECLQEINSISDVRVDDLIGQ